MASTWISDEPKTWAQPETWNESGDLPTSDRYWESAAIHVLFHLESDEPLPGIISQSAIEAAIDFIKVCCQHTAFIAGRGRINNEQEIVEAGNIPGGIRLHVHVRYYS